jgi:dipeptidyl aminopeptidase/acylaminoacyl peptidase
MTLNLKSEREMTLRNSIKFLMVNIIVLSLAVSLAAVTHETESQAEMKTEKISVTQWYQLGPQVLPLPVFHDEKAKAFKMKELLKFEPLAVKEITPRENVAVQWFNAKPAQWQVSLATDSLQLALGDSTVKLPRVAYLATYLNAQRWLQVKLTVSGCQLFKIYVNGEEKGANEKVVSGKKFVPAKTEVTLKLDRGKHLLVIKTVAAPENAAPWEIKACLEPVKPATKTDLVIELSPSRIFQLADLLEGPKVSGASISADGQRVALTFQRAQPPEDATESWIEIKKFADGSPVQTFRGGMKISGFQWAPTGHRFSYVASGKESSTLWIFDLEKGTSEALIRDVKDFGDYTWSPDEQFIIYTISEKGEKEERGVKRLTGIQDRWSYFRTKSYLYQVLLKDGATRRLTAGELTTSLNAIHPDSRSLLFSRTVEDFQQRPYSRQELYRLDLVDWQVEKIWSGYFLAQVSWSPDGKKLLVLASPATFGDLGRNVPDGTLPNDYDNQAYIFDPDFTNGEALTKNFDPSIAAAVWSEFENCIYFETTDRAFQTLYRYDLKQKTFAKIETGVEVISAFDLARTAPRMVYYGTSVNEPTNVFALDLKSNKKSLLAAPEKITLQDVQLGKVADWNFINSRNVPIDGHVYYPPDFDPAKKYPAIVYYYGGTSPVSRDFGGRYPKNYYAGQGYVVYVLQPSGAVGFGQAFSALHVNDWGKIVADEIIDGVQKFLDAHPFVDRKKVGCIGASFGGFMTQLLLTRTDIFAAAVSHAGISALSSYWGEGYWGYSYSAVATANSFPWNRQDIYVNQSPLFAADKIVTPLLLTHGAVDTNVPPGESEQMYIALKLLGREVEYLKFDEQNHWILSLEKRRLWTRSIIAWFDRWLKDQPEFWNDLYPGIED